MATAPKTTKTTTTTTAKTTRTSAAAPASAAIPPQATPAAAPSASAAPAQPQSEAKRGILVAVLFLLALALGAGGFYLYDRHGGQLLAELGHPVAVVENTTTIAIETRPAVVNVSTNAVHSAPGGERCLAIVAPHATRLVMTGAATGGPAQAAVAEWPLEVVNWQQQGMAFATTVCLPVADVERHAESGMSLCQDGQRGSCWAFRPGAAMATLVSADIGPRRPLCLAANDWCSQVVIGR